MTRHSLHEKTLNMQLRKTKSLTHYTAILLLEVKDFKLPINFEAVVDNL